jgi:Putative DNA-binding domain
MASLHALNFATAGESELYPAISDFAGVTRDPGDRQQEGYTVDFKEEWGERSLRVVAAFANTFGGIIVVGISERDGRADEIVGVAAKSEITTQIASSIASNITPTPDYDIAECALPTDPSKRLAVLRVRANDRVHYLLKGDRPIYIRNVDEAVPARVPELRALIDRAWSAANREEVVPDLVKSLPADFKVTRAREAGTVQERMRNRVDAQSFMRVVIAPRRPVPINLDYLYEEHFQNLVAARFSPFQAAVMGDISTESFSRSRKFFVYKNYRSDLDMEALWAVSAAGTIGFASSIGIHIGQLYWSLPDVAANIAQTLSLSNDVLTAQGYYGEIDISIEVAPGGGRLSKEGDAFAAIQRKDCFPYPWPIVIPQYSEKPIHLEGGSVERLSFNERFDQSGTIIARIINDLLRDMGYAADLNLIRQAVQMRKS